jgi:hypothetical protein
MTGLCWFVQIVHYPLFHHVRLEDFPGYERKNTITGFITVPLMFVELGTGLALLYFNFDALYFTNIVLLGIIWLSTFVYQVPLHVKLMETASQETINRLVKTNWIRTISWTLRSGLLIFILWKLL